ncbi:carcinoembryonic antigen-related cell adhesion molecule 5-like [Engraulis encrasicolus]|uniref:carcinoembryonic antigen-related cell adhesion molecule 5-like n=1 Tax=Engraulis encrasicolus TaxID=184585 RepID=UPI002FCFB846
MPPGKKERISSVTLVASQTDLVEFNSSVTLTCSASGSSPSFQWFNRSDEVTGSDGVLTDRGTLTIESVTRYDTGPYKCNASNIVSSEMSSVVHLTISYGPDNPIVIVTPRAEFYSSGSTIVLSCSSESSPAAQIQWALNGALLGKEEPELRLENVQTSQSGEYTCWAHNSKTQRYKLSSPTSITVLVPGPGHSGLSSGAIESCVSDHVYVNTVGATEKQPGPGQPHVYETLSY